MTKTGRRIEYGIAMLLSGLVLLISLTSILGLWSLEGALVNSVTELLGAVEKATDSLRQPIQRIDRNLEKVQSITSQISEASNQVSENVTEKGMVQLVLPEQQEQQLVALSSSLNEAFSTLHAILTAGVNIYRMIDQLPFISLPAPSQEQVDQFETSSAEIEYSVDNLKEDVTLFRSGMGEQISKVQAGADSLTSYLSQIRNQLADLDAKLADAQEGLIGLQRKVVNLILLANSIVTLLLAWVIYSQIAMLRLFKHLWKGMGTNGGSEEKPDRKEGIKNNNTLETDPQ